ncbi:MAG: HEAT repeat domain-containing protein [Deltaproteobacteria bacterium]|nr:HEAT repeat domain-containing protein [Deltaproteobacteria bacterium]
MSLFDDGQYDYLSPDELKDLETAYRVLQTSTDPRLISTSVSEILGAHVLSEEEDLEPVDLPEEPTEDDFLEETLAQLVFVEEKSSYDPKLLDFVEVALMPLRKPLLQAGAIASIEYFIEKASKIEGFEAYQELVVAHASIKIFDEDPDVRKAAVSLLQHVPSEESTDRLLAALSDESEAVAIQAGSILAKRPHSLANKTDLLYAELAREGVSPKLRAQIAAVCTLTNPHDTRLVKIIKAEIENPSGDEFSMQARAIFQRCDLRDFYTVEEAFQILEDKSASYPLRATIAINLSHGSIELVRALETFTRIMEDPQEDSLMLQTMASRLARFRARVDQNNIPDDVTDEALFSKYERLLAVYEGKDTKEYKDAAMYAVAAVLGRDRLALFSTGRALPEVALFQEICINMRLEDAPSHYPW